MKLLCVIDHFGSGGAQRQLVELACSLKKRGHEVAVFIYYPEYSFFRNRIDAANIQIHHCEVTRPNPVQILRKLTKLLGQNKYDIVLSFLNNPNLYAELSRVWHKNTKLVVSERSNFLDDKSRIGSYLRRNCYRLADHVVTNSTTQRDWLTKSYCHLTGKVTAIYNGFNIDEYSSYLHIPENKNDLKLLAIGRVDAVKNGLNLFYALKLFHKNNGWAPTISWVGRRDATPEGLIYAVELENQLNQCMEIGQRWSWLGERDDVIALLRSHHALIHPSLYEGLPNVVCEALASGRPVLASNVCDHRYLIGDNERGFLFDPNQPEEICGAIQKLSESSSEKWKDMHEAAIDYAHKHLSVHKLTTEYENLFMSLLGERDKVASK